jgi:hypothetical protein
MRSHESSAMVAMDGQSIVVARLPYNKQASARRGSTREMSQQQLLRLCVNCRQPIDFGSQLCDGCRTVANLFIG